MAEYIEREALMEVINWANFPEEDWDTVNNASYALDLVRNFPAADVVEVVRCKDCKWLPRTIEAEGYWLCNQRLVREDDFCSYGQRKENNND